MKDKIIQSFTIKGLFGLYDVHIPFENDVMILIGENGMGKTQIMNLLYYLMIKRFDRLEEFNFESIEIKFLSSEKITVNKHDIGNFYPERVIKGSQINLFITRRTVRVPASKIPHKMEKIYKSQLKDYEILHLPTYRRIEEDLKNLGYDEDEFELSHRDKRLIHFGMEDVDERFQKITQEIERLSKEGLAKISSEILSELVNGQIQPDSTFLEKINEKDIDIILARVGDGIKTDDKDRIKSIVSTRKINEKDYSLLYFLEKLMNAYEEQRELDNSIKTFRDVCNKYLVNKDLIYDESKVELYVKAKGSDKPLPLGDLSSGEKQIISIFSKIYLSPPDSEFIALVDEPELSLSIFWQRNFLPDIYNSGKVRFLFAVTHSPFIFENELDKYAVSLNEYMKPAAPAQIEQPA